MPTKGISYKRRPKAIAPTPPTPPPLPPHYHHIPHEHFIVALSFLVISLSGIIMGFGQASAQGGRQPVSNTVCSDSDGGKDIKTAGKTTLTKTNSQNPKIKTITSSKTDACVGAAGVREYFCTVRNGQGVISSQVISCGSKGYCSKGACITRSPISQQVVSSTPSTTPSSTPPIATAYYGVCIVRDIYTDAPSSASPDIGEGYAKKNLLNIINYQQVARECTPAIYQDLENRFCQSNRRNNQIHNYSVFHQAPDRLGTVGDTYGCPDGGCNWRYCPGAVTSTPPTSPPTTTPSSTPPVAVASSTPPRLIPACETFFGCTVLGFNATAGVSTNIGEYHFDLRHPTPTAAVTEITFISLSLEGSYIAPARGDDQVVIDAYYGSVKVGSGTVTELENGTSRDVGISFSPTIKTSDIAQQSYFQTLILKTNTNDSDFRVLAGETKSLRPHIKGFTWRDPNTGGLTYTPVSVRDDLRNFTSTSTVSSAGTLPMILITADAPVPAGSSITQAVLRGTQLGRFKVTNMGWVKATVEKIALADYGTHTGTSTMFDLVYSDQNSSNYTQNSVGTQQNNLIFNNTSISIDGGAYRYVTVVLKDLGQSTSGDSYGLYVHPGITSTFSATEYDLGFDYNLDGNLDDTAYGEIQGKPVLGAVNKL
jgi:hypothetical protein